MKFLVDTHLLLWAAAEPHRLSPRARALMQDVESELLFSAASIWEVTIKHGIGRQLPPAAPRLLRRGLLDTGYVELPVSSEHALALEALPRIHNDPFDRLLIAQSVAEGITLLTVDAGMAEYGDPVRRT